MLFLFENSLAKISLPNGDPSIDTYAVGMTHLILDIPVYFGS